jgi:polar amino acid transport system substrate-binding protein
MQRLAISAQIALVIALVVSAGCGSSTTTSSSKQACTQAPTDLIAANTFTVGADITFPPMEYYDANHNPIGFDIDIAQALAKTMCLPLNLVNNDFNGLLPALNAKKFDIAISSLGITAKRQQVVDFVPYFVEGGGVVVSKKFNKLSSVTAYSQLCGLRAATEAGTVYVDTVKSLNASTCPTNNPIVLSTFPTSPEAFLQIEKGIIDVDLTTWATAKYQVTKLTDLKVLNTSPLEPLPAGIAVRKGDVEMTTAVQSALTAIESNGEYDRILAKWQFQGTDIRTWKATS